MDIHPKQEHPTVSEPKSMDDLPDVEHTFRYCADFAEFLVPEPKPAEDDDEALA